MDELILRSLQRRITAAETELLQAWRAQSPANESRYRELEQIWQLTAATPQPRRRPVPTAASLVGGRDPAANDTPSHRRAVRRALAAAAAVILVIAGTLGVLRSTDTAGEALAMEIVTGAAESASAHLPDGTIVRLGPGSRLVSLPSSSTREVRLDGTAFFAVAHDTARPFLVRSRGGTVRVLGTRFRVTTIGDDLDVTVVEGTVAVAAADAQVVVAAGEAATVRAGQAAPAVRSAEPGDGFRPFTGFFAFQSTPLRDVAAEFELRLGERLRFASRALEDITVTVWFHDAAYSDMITVVCRIADVRCSTRDGETWIER